MMATVCSSSPYEELIVCGIVACLKMKCNQSRYGSLEFVFVAESGLNGGEPPVLDKTSDATFLRGLLMLTYNR